MERILNLDSVKIYNDFNKNETLHPLISIVDLSKADPRMAYQLNFNIYCIILKQVKCGDIRYGNNTYDYQEGTLVFFAPGQTAEVTSDEIYQPSGIALVFHPDFLHNTNLGKKMDEYTFFSYRANEALHLSEKERKIVLEFFNQIQYELNQSIDKHSKGLIASSVELFLNYCIRFYDRQFITRESMNIGIIEKFENVLNNYFKSNKPSEMGLPTVSYCASELNLSPNYFGDLVRRESGRTAQEFIHLKIINIAKEKVFSVDKSVSEIAYELGFKYPQHFTRLFKSKTGYSPLEYKNLN